MAARLVIVALLIGISFVSVVAWRRSIARSSLRRSNEILGTRFPKSEWGESRYLLFTSRYCIPCGVLKNALEESGQNWKEVRVEVDPNAFRRLGISTTPVLIELNEKGIAQRLWGPESLADALASIGSPETSHSSTEEQVC
jgi:hypothetical protein